MSHFAFKQPNGLFGVFSDNSDSVISFNMTELSLILHFATTMARRDAEQKVWRAVADQEVMDVRWHAARPASPGTLRRFADAMRQQRENVETWRDRLTVPSTDTTRWRCVNCDTVATTLAWNVPEACCPLPTLSYLDVTDAAPSENIRLEPPFDEEGAAIAHCALYGGSIAGMKGAILWVPPLRGFYASYIEVALSGKDVVHRKA